MIKAMERILDEAMDLYLKEMTGEQQVAFDAWLQVEIAAGRLSDDSPVEVLVSVTRAWAGGWLCSRKELVECLHSL